MSNKTTTARLEQILKSVNNKNQLAEYINNSDNISPYTSFIDYFTSLDKTSELKPATLYKLANIERSYCYKILDGTKTPGRNKIISLCLAAGLNRNETKKALESGGEAPLNVRNTRDAVLYYAIGQHMSVLDTNELLDELSLETL